MKNHFIFGYAGNKRQEVEKIYEAIIKYIDLNKIKTIVEPFCGTSAFSYYLSTKYPKKFTYILNDSDEWLIELYNILIDEKETIKLSKDVNKLKNTIKNKEQYVAIVKEKNINSWLIAYLIYNIKVGLYPSKEKQNRFKEDYVFDFNKSNVCDFLRNEKIILTCDDGLNVYEKYKKDPKCLIFIDPPYMSSCNSFYKEKNTNIYEYLYFNKIENEKAKIFLCLENTWIIKMLFDNNKLNNVEYDKTYEATKKKTKHVIINNIILNYI